MKRNLFFTAIMLIFSLSLYAEVIANGACGQDLTWTLDDNGTLTISGTGDMENYFHGSPAPWYEYRAKITNTIINEGVTSIGNNAFIGCFMTDIIIPNSITSIGDRAFWDCSNLTSIEISNNVTTIGFNSFSSCDILTSIVVNSSNPIYDSRDNCNAIIETATNTLIAGCQSTIIPDNVISIGDSAFLELRGSTFINIPNGVKHIGNYAFFGCSLTSIDIPNSVTSIGHEAFASCYGLTSIVIPNSVTSIGTNPFRGCHNVTSMVVDISNPIYDSRNNCNAIIETATNTIIAGCQNTIIPNSVTSIGSSAFMRCSSLTSIEIPNGVTSIGDYAFYASGLTSLTIPNSMISIGKRAFYKCTSLTSIEIPYSVTNIGDQSFLACSGLTSITNYATTPQEIDASVFYGVNRSIPLYVPAESVEAYKNANVWKEFNILPIRQHTFTITFYDYDGVTVLKEAQTVEKGKDAIAPADPERKGYKFIGWDKDFTNVQSDLIVKAKYAKILIGNNNCTEYEYIIVPTCDIQ